MPLFHQTGWNKKLKVMSTNESPTVQEKFQHSWTVDIFKNLDETKEVVKP